jgi:hypothetical protein
MSIAIPTAEHYARERSSANGRSLTHPGWTSRKGQTMRGTQFAQLTVFVAVAEHRSFTRTQDPTGANGTVGTHGTHGLLDRNCGEADHLAPITLPSEPQLLPNAITAASVKATAVGWPSRLCEIGDRKVRCGRINNRCAASRIVALRHGKRRHEIDKDY